LIIIIFIKKLIKSCFQFSIETQFLFACSFPIIKTLDFRRTFNVHLISSILGYAKNLSKNFPLMLDTIIVNSESLVEMSHSIPLLSIFLFFIYHFHFIFSSYFQKMKNFLLLFKILLFMGHLFLVNSNLSTCSLKFI